MDPTFAVALAGAELDDLLEAVCAKIGHRTMADENRWELALQSLIEAKTEHPEGFDPSPIQWSAVQRLTNPWYDREATANTADLTEDLTPVMMRHACEIVVHIDGVDGELLDGGQSWDCPPGAGVTVWRLAQLQRAYEALGEDMRQLQQRLGDAVPVAAGG